MVRINFATIPLHVIERTVGQVSSVIGRGLMTPLQRPHRVIISRLTRELKRIVGGPSVPGRQFGRSVTCRVETGTEASWRELLSRLTSSGKFFTIVDNGGT